MRVMNEYFPIFINMSRQRPVVIGGGKIAGRRIRSLVDFTDQILVAAPRISEELETLAASGRISWRRESYSPSLLEGATIVLACTDRPEVNDRIVRDCRERGIPVNHCGDRDQCDFYFPGLAVSDPVVVGVTAGGKDHRRAAEVTRLIKDMLRGQRDG